MLILLSSWPAIRLADLHPIVVHFPIALLIASVGMDVLSLVLRRAGLTTAATWLLVLGVPGALAALLTGKISGSVLNTAAASDLLHLHKICAVGASLTFGTLLLLRLVWLAPRVLYWLPQVVPATQSAATGGQRALRTALPALYTSRLPGIIVVMYLALSVVGVVLLGLTGYFGGAIVYDRGVGPIVP
ncbi:MAG TPA: DUF2231 domain-containing protein [Ktedonobacterales bacterium]